MCDSPGRRCLLDCAAVRASLTTGSRHRRRQTRGPAACRSRPTGSRGRPAQAAHGPVCQQSGSSRVHAGAGLSHRPRPAAACAGCAGNPWEISRIGLQAGRPRGARPRPGDFVMNKLPRVERCNESVGRSCRQWPHTSRNRPTAVPPDAAASANRRNGARNDEVVCPQSCGKPRFGHPRSRAGDSPAGGSGDR